MMKFFLSALILVLSCENNLDDSVPAEHKRSKIENIIICTNPFTRPVIIQRATPIFKNQQNLIRNKFYTVLDFIVDENGKPQDINIMLGHPDHHEPAIEAIKQFRFTSPLKNGIPTSMKWRYAFRLDP